MGKKNHFLRYSMFMQILATFHAFFSCYFCWLTKNFWSMSSLSFVNTSVISCLALPWPDLWLKKVSFLNEELLTYSSLWKPYPCIYSALSLTGNVLYLQTLPSFRSILTQMSSYPGCCLGWLFFGCWSPVAKVNSFLMHVHWRICVTTCQQTLDPHQKRTSELHRLIL